MDVERTILDQVLLPVDRCFLLKRSRLDDIVDFVERIHGMLDVCLVHLLGKINGLYSAVDCVVGY